MLIHVLDISGSEGRDPLDDYEKINLERVDYWIPRGAQPSDTVKKIIERARTGKKLVKTAPAAEA